jgi:hypothetical protein
MVLGELPRNPRAGTVYLNDRVTRNWVLAGLMQDTG